MITFIKIWAGVCAVDYLAWAWCALWAKANPSKFKSRIIFGSVYISEYISVYLGVFCVGSSLWILIWFLFFR